VLLVDKKGITLASKLNYFSSYLHQCLSFSVFVMDSIFEDINFVALSNKLKVVIIKVAYGMSFTWLFPTETVYESVKMLLLFCYIH